MTSFRCLPLLLAACTANDVSLDAGAATTTDPVAIAAPIPCRAPTKGLLMGDSIVSNMFYDAKDHLQQDGDIVLSMAVGGESTPQQMNNWITGTVPYPVPAMPYRGDPSFGWIFLQVGVNEMRAGFAANVSCMWHAQLLDDIHQNNPDAKVIFAVVAPARGYFDSIAVPWQNVVDLNDCLRGLGATSVIYTALDDGTGALPPPYDSGDMLHPSTEGSMISADIIRDLVAQAYGGQRPCNGHD